MAARFPAEHFNSYSMNFLQVIYGTVKVCIQKQKTSSISP